MIKPVACKCGSLPSVLGEKGAYECACLARYPFCENTTLIVAKTRLGAILRWNLWAWREKRKIERSGKK